MDEVSIEDPMAEPPSRRMKVGERLGVIETGAVPVRVRRATACFELRAPVSSRVFGVFYDDGREPELPPGWSVEHRSLVIQQFQALIEEYDRYPQLRRYESTEVEREAIRKFLDWVGEQPSDLLVKDPLKRWWLLKHHLTLSVRSASLDEIQDLVLEAVGVDAVRLAAECQDIERRRAESAS